MSRLRKSLVAVAVALAVGAGGHSVVTSPRAAAWLAGAVEASAADALGEDVVIGRLEPSLWPPSIHVEGLVVRSREDRRVLVTMKSADADIALFPLRASRLVLDSPDVTLRIGQDLPGLAEGDSGPLERLPWDELVVEGARVELDIHGTRLVAEDLDLGPDPIVGRSTLAIQRLAVEQDEWVQAIEGVELSGLEVGPERIEIPDLDLDFPVAHVDGELRVELAGQLEGLLSVDIDPTELPLPEGLSAEGELFADLQLGGTSSAPELQALVVGTPALRHEGDRHGFGALEASLRLHGRGVDIERLQQVIGEGHLEGEGFVGWDGAVHGLTLRMEGLSLHEALIESAAFTNPYVDLLIDGEIQLAGALSPLSLEGPMSLALAEFEVGDDGLRGPHDSILVIPTGSLDGVLSFDEDGVRIDARDLVAGRTSGRVDAWLPYEGDMDIEAHLPRADLRTFSPLADVGLVGRGLVEARIHGPFDDPDIDGRVSVHDFGIFGYDAFERLEGPVICHDLETVVFDFRARRSSTRVRGELLLDFTDDFQMDLGVLVGEGRIEDLVEPFAKLPGVEGDVTGVLTLYGPPSTLDGEVDLRLSDVALYGERFGSGRGVARMSRGVLGIEELSVQRGDERLVVTGTVGEELEVDLRASSVGLRLERLGALEPAEGRVTGDLVADLRIRGALASMEPEGRLVASDLRINGARAPALSVDVRSDAREVRFAGGSRDGRIQAEARVDRAGAWSALGELDEAPLHLLAPVAADGRAIDGKLSGLVIARGEGSDGRLELTASKTELAWADLALVAPGTWTLRWDSDGVVIEDLVLEGHRTHLAAAVAISGGRVRATVDGAWDVAWIPALSDAFSDAHGIGRIEFALDGPLEAPDGELRLGIHQGRLVSPLLPEPLERAELRLRGGPSLWEVQEGRGELGGGRVEVGGRVLAERWRPVRYELEARVFDARISALDDLPPMVGEADLHLRGAPDELVLGGTATIDDMVFVERIDWEQWAVDFREQRLVEGEDTVTERPSFDIDVAIVAEDSVRIRNNVGEGLADAELRLVGDDTRIGLVGTIRMEPGGRVFVQGREFVVARAEIRYVDPYSYDPDLDILLETEVRSRERTWRVTYPVVGPFSDWRAEPHSDPNLPSADIHALLLFGMTREELESSGGASAALAAEGIDLLVTGEGSRALDRLGSDALVEVFQYTRMDVVSGVSQRGTVGSDTWRILVERDVQAPADATLIGEFSLDDRYLAMEKALARNIYLRLFWSSLERERSRDLGGAYGADVEVRWEAD